MVPVDLSGLISSRVLTVCDPQNQQELDQFTKYAALFRSDGEAMCLALAAERKWVVATDDRKAIRLAQRGGLTRAAGVFSGLPRRPGGRLGRSRDRSRRAGSPARR